jgi:hypothetical protein
LNKILKFSAGILLLSVTAYSYASNTSGVHGPGVKADDSSMQLRLALSPSDENAEPDNWAYRLHYQHAFNDEFRGRMILQYRDRGSFPEMFAINWTNQWDLSNGIRVRGILIGAWEFGSDLASNGTEVETRGSVTKKLEGGLTVGVEMFNDFGRVGDFGSFNNQSHQIGPMIGGSLGDLKYEVRYLAGMSSGSRDHNFGLRFNKAF